MVRNLPDQAHLPPRLLIAFLLRCAATLLAAAAVGGGADAGPPPDISSLAFWTAPAKPFPIVGPIYYVGTRGLGVYLITTPAGHILIDAGLSETTGDIVRSIERLGFSIRDVRVLLISHGHFDHAGGLAALKAASGAELAVMAGDAEAVQSGGRFDRLYRALPSRSYPPVKVDRILADGDTVALGGVTLTAHLAAGHTAGSTTWVTDVTDGGRTYRVVFPCCTNVNPGLVLAGEGASGVADQFRRTFAMLQSLAPDIVLPPHTETFGFEQHRQRAERTGVAGWLDGGSYREWIAGAKAEFEARVAAEAEGPVHN
jgi:metallo-beta-lactamase class B